MGARKKTTKTKYKEDVASHGYKELGELAGVKRSENENEREVHKKNGFHTHFLKE